MISSGARSSNELQRLDSMAGQGDKLTYSGCRATCPIPCDKQVDHNCNMHLTWHIHHKD